MNYHVIGKSVPRQDSKAKVTGTALYIDDLRFPRTLHLKVLRAGVAHAKIKSIEISEAKLSPGVQKVITGRSKIVNQEILYGTCIFDQPPLAIDKVRHAGEVVAAVIAETEKEALTAVQKIRVEYEELPFVLDPIESASSTSPLIHEWNGKYKHLPTFVPVPGSNIFYKYHLKKGNHEDVFQDADVIIEDNFEYPLMNHAAIEPHGAIACWNREGELHIWSSSQAPFVVREVLTQMFHIPMTNIHIHVPFLGGGFGGKSDYTIEPLLAVCARAVPGYHVKFRLTRKEVFIGTVLGRGLKGKMKIGSKKDGTFVGLEAELYFSDGAYADTSCNVVLAAGHNSAGPYYFPNCSLQSFGVYTNSPPVGAMRGYGHPEGQFMIERLIEQLARKLDMDSNELRMLNFLKAGDTNSLGQQITAHNGDMRECFEKMVAALKANPLPEEDEVYFYGRGVAALVKSPVQAANASSSVFLKFNEDLTVNISIGGIEMGQGCLTVLAQIAAESLQLPLEKVRINYEINTQLTPYEWQSVASMTTMRVGNAIITACKRAIEQFKQNAALVLNCDSKELIYDGKNVSRGQESISLKNLVLGYQYEDGHTIGDPILASGSSVVRNVTFPNLESGQYQPYEWTFGAQGCDISIEKSTGKIKVLHIVTALDIGKVINPKTVHGQITGGVLMGIGAALKEIIIFDANGIMETTTLRKYATPRISDMPDKFTYILIENPQPDGPYGARPMAEHPIIGVPPAILNALQNATGISITKLPATSDKVLIGLVERS
ncbi:MAG: xanthine dehydrogenase family protein molybdopterin-binding subunit [Promethearchaeota archaeon]